MTTPPPVVSRIGRLRLPSLSLITDRHSLGEGALEETVVKAAEGGANLVQLREKDMAAGDLFALARLLRQALHGRSLLVINDRLDVAQACGAAGVHLPESGLSVAIARWLLGPHALIGRSVHSVEAAVEAAGDGADYVQLGTIFQSPSKPDAKPAGTALVEEVVKAVSIPVLAVGGINAKNVAKAIEAGASGVSVISAVLTAKDPKAAAEGIVKAMGDAWQARTVESKTA